MQPLGQLITTRLTELLILGLVRRLDLLDDLLSDLPELLIALPARVTRQPSAIDRHHPGFTNPRLITQPQHLAEQVSQRALMTNYEPSDRGVIRHHIAGNHPIGHILATVTLDRPRRPHIGRERIQHQPHHHRRLIRRPAVTIRPIRAIERRHIHLTHGIDHEPRQMIPRQPIPHVRRQQEPLLTTTFNEVLRHTGIVLNAPDRTLCATASRAAPCAATDEG